MVRRSSIDIAADAERAAEEIAILVSVLNEKKAAATRLHNQSIGNLDIAIATAAAAATDADQSQKDAQAKPAEAEEKCSSARIKASSASALAGLDLAGPAADCGATTLLDEWKECRTSIDRFDKILVDLRKTGIGFVTTIIGGAAFLLARAGAPAPAGAAQAASTSPPSLVATVPAIKVSVFFVIALLIFGLYIIDRVHQILLSVAVDRATSLERSLGFKLTQEISKQFRMAHATLIGIIVYGLPLVTAAFIFFMALEPTASFHITLISEQIYTILIFLGFSVAMIVYLYLTKKK